MSRETIQDLIELIKSGQVQELEADLQVLSRWLDIYWQERDYQALTPRDPDELHPMAGEYRLIFAPDNPDWPHY